jgi:predicted kinase
MSARRLLVITGLPATGKTTLARALATRYSAALIAKDCIKEPLLDTIGAPDSAASRRLSDASFAVMFRLAYLQLSCGVSVVLEGNFRPLEHVAPLGRLAAAPPSATGVRCAQVLCRVEEGVRRRRLGDRASQPGRHAGHRDAEQLHSPTADAGAFVDIPGERFVWEASEGTDPSVLLHALDRWWNEEADSSSEAPGAKEEG